MIVCNIECVATRKMTEEEVEHLWALLKNCGVTEMRFVDYTEQQNGKEQKNDKGRSN